LRQDLQSARSRHVLEGTSDDLVRILTKLTTDLERFDSMVLSQRKMLEHLAGDLGDFDNDQINRQSERISLEAAEMVASARQALEQLSRMAEPTKSLTLHAPHRSRPRGLPKDRLAD
jgi:phage shock protein A